MLGVQAQISQDSQEISRENAKIEGIIIPRLDSPPHEYTALTQLNIELVKDHCIMGEMLCARWSRC